MQWCPFDGPPSSRLDRVEVRISFHILLILGVPAEHYRHAETKITERYAHLSPETVQSYISVLDGEDVPTPAVRNLPGWLKGK
jgi:hypothetical protein